MEEEAAATTKGAEGGAPRTYRRVERSEKQLPGGGYSRYYHSESVVTFGGGPPMRDAAMQPAAGAMLWASIAAGLVVGRAGSRTVWPSPSHASSLTALLAHCQTVLTATPLAIFYLRYSSFSHVNYLFVCVSSRFHHSPLF